MIPKNQVLTSIVKADAPTSRETLVLRTLIFLGITAVGLFVWWFFSEERIGYEPLYWPLTIALLFKFLKTLHEWYHYFHISVPKAPSRTKEYKVDILTTACPGEPVEMIINTLRAMQNISYPHTSYLCDEGNDPVLKKACDELGVIHVTRTEKKNAKAGNVNNALRQAKGDICIILDPDHEPVSEFIDRVLPYFEDEKVGYVQSVQAYKNRKESLVALGACEQTYHFYGPMMMAMNSYGTVQAIGANCAFRRKALDSIGGHAPGLAEDMHTSMLLHSKGWKSVYIPEILTRGLVPSSLPAYYKQQLKWSRGTFDLLFYVLPTLFFKLSLRQKLHYLTVPLYFFYGFIDLINIVIPVLSLVLAEFPWQVDLVEFVRVSLPVFIMTLLIRQYAQRWLLEKHERGFHIVGGLLKIGTWWVFAVGFIYTVFRIKVPYIPTPKENHPENSFTLCIPNIVICCITIAAIAYGLYIDWSPYSFFMAGLAAINVLILGYITAIGQQKLVFTILTGLKKSLVGNYIYPSRLAWWNFRQSVYYFLRKHSFYAGCLTILFTGTLFYQDKKEVHYFKSGKDTFKKESLFLSGITITSYMDSLSVGENDSLRVLNESSAIGHVVIHLDSTWDDSVCVTRIERLAIVAKYPMITLVPHWESVLLDTHDMENFFSKFSQRIKRYNNTFFINPLGFPSPSVNDSLYEQAWVKVHGIFREEGAGNVSWTWAPLNTSFTHSPPMELVDWISIGSTKDSIHCLSIEDTAKVVSAFPEKPIVWMSNRATDLLAFKGDNYSAVKAVVVESDWEDFISCSHKVKRQSDIKDAEEQIFHSKFVTGDWGSYELLVDNKPFFIKGVSYHSPHFLFEDHVPMTRSRLKKDFRKIKEMGANTIRRYNPDIYDRNILSIAGEEELKVIYGFWFDPEVDYLRDTSKLNEYMELVVTSVNKNKDYSSILGWSLGNDTYSSLKNYYDPPYLMEVQKAYLRFLQQLTLTIKSIDPSRPVVVIHNHTEDLRATLEATQRLAPSADIVGVNSHDKDYLKKLHLLIEKSGIDKPYLISEFSHGTYWNPYFNNYTEGMLLENPDYEKSHTYMWNWIKYVELKKGKNVGGVAYTWRDKAEGTATWSGLTDYKDRCKPSYYALKKIWNKAEEPINFPWMVIRGETNVTAGVNYEYKTIQEFPGDFSYEWYIQFEDEKTGMGKMEKIGKGPVLDLTIPATENKMRLYVYMIDERSNVVTASLPLLIKR